MLENTGILIEKQRAESDFILGGDSEIEYKEINETGDWTEFLPHGEVQKNKNMDSMACVSYSLLNCLETQFNFLIGNNKLPKEHLTFLEKNGYFFNEQINLSDRYLAKMSGTSHYGNYQTKVVNSARHEGILPEKDWGFGGDFDWNKYYKEIPEELKAKAKEFYKFFDIQYEWVSYRSSASIEDLKKNLKQSPIQIATPICTWNAPIIKPCGKTKPSHATMLTGIRSEVMDIFDHYIKYEKKISMDYPIPFAMKIVLNIKPIKNKNMILTIDKNNHQYLVEENSKFGVSIVDEKMLEKITSHFVKNGIELEAPLLADLKDYLIIRGATEKELRAFFNI